ncbi:MAG: signal transduction histidine kinase [Flavobacteriales bacterium]|jgi:signal transduction histidine kinase
MRKPTSFIQCFELGVKFIVLLFVSFLSFANASANSNGPPQEILVFTDSTSALSFEDVQKETFKTVEGSIPNLGVSDNAHWIKFELARTTQETVLELQNPNIDSIFFYQVLPEGIRIEDIQGEAFPFAQRQFKVPNFVFRLQPSNESIVYLRLVSGKQLMVPIRIENEDTVIFEQNNKNIFFGVYSGIILVMFLYNLFLWFSVRDNNYLYYVLFIFFVGITQLILNGYGNQYFWPENNWLGLRSAHYSGVLSGVMTVLFAQHYLRTKQFTPIIHNILHGYLIVYLGAFILATIGNFTLSYNLINFCAVASLLLVFAGIRSYQKGFKPALFFLIAFVIFLIGVTIFVLRDVGVFPNNIIAKYALPVGSALEVVLLSFALADRINQLKREKEKEQLQKLKALKENERIITQQNVLLEVKVNERTNALETSNADLNITLDELRSAQAQLVDAEKMASLGQMTAGIAHELNNPINFVSSNIKPLRRDLDDLLAILACYESAEPGSEQATEKINQARALSQELELGFLKTEIDLLMKGIEDGAQRTAEIVKGLRIFSRLDEDDLKKADINECLRSTLIILKTTIRGATNVKEEFDVNLPKIQCYPGKLNQVFMNIIANAVHATENSGKPLKERLVAVKTTEVNDKIEIRIKDNGGGMNPEVKSKMFDPFFTTKDVGEGTGLGLSIVLGIVNHHNGKIVVETEPNLGTEFIITLPKVP